MMMMMSSANSNNKSSQQRQMIGKTISRNNNNNINLSSASGNSSSSLRLICALMSVTAIFSFYVGLVIGTMSSLQVDAPAAERRDQQLLVDTAAADGVSGGDDEERFPLGVRDFMSGMSVVDRDDFAQSLNLGLPMDSTSRQNQNVMIVYQSPNAMPNNPVLAAAAATTNAHKPAAIPQIATTQEALENCDFVNLVLTDFAPPQSSGKRRQCTALMGQYEAFHIQKYMRLPPEGEESAETGRKLDRNLPLRFVNRGAQSNGRKSTNPPDKDQTIAYWAVLQRYLGNFDNVLAEVKPILESVAVDNTVIVLVCNFGQSELLMNFVCSARSRNLDVSNILVFATDTDTRDLCLGLGIATYYDAVNYADMPKQAAGRYADKTFMAMMMAKVFCVHMTAWLGYDVLFQDVDVIWYKNPLPYFHDKESADKSFDIYFQDEYVIGMWIFWINENNTFLLYSNACSLLLHFILDNPFHCSGNHSLYYAPYSANTGFYYVRSNERTRHFFNSFLLAGDLILSTRSHQVPLVALLQEHASMYALQVKIFSRAEDDFPGGHAFHRRREFIIDVMNGAKVPYIFHMSWTLNKQNKVKFFRQMGEWFVNDKCVQHSAPAILGLTDAVTIPGNGLLQPCCAADFIFSCHYRDKPSKKPCRDSPPIDKEQRSFW